MRVAASAAAPATNPRRHQSSFATTTTTTIVDDDDPSARHAVTDLLTLLGLEVFTASSGAELLRIPAIRSADAIFLDHSLTDMTGSELVGRLRKDPHFQNVPMISVTGEAERARAEGRDIYDLILEKPVRLAELAGALQHFEVEMPVRLFVRS